MESIRIEPNTRIDKLRIDNKNDTVRIPVEVLRCINERFDMITRRLRCIYYFVACLQLICGSLSVVTHAHENDGLFGGPDTLKAEGIILSSLSEIFAGFLIVLNLHSAMQQCRQAFAFGKKYELSKRPMPTQILKFMTNTPTFCFKHPFAYNDCMTIKNEIDKI